ncbi:MAG TPA: outer membrane beta-barrel protein [Pyrinomonadaceae bacterium]|nr:outer membrane beta-barrel protein [Pyrinomonadaceae bacterium]
MKTSIYLLLTFVTFAAVVVAQDKKDRVEIGVQSTSLTFFEPESPFNVTNSGIGGRVTYNFNRSLAAEAEINFLPQKQFVLSSFANSSAIQAQFGVKLGKRFERFGLFAKVRPGFLSVDALESVTPETVTVVTGFNFKVERTNLFSLDTGGVLELYPSRRIVVRFDAGDTAIRHPELFEVVFPGTGEPPFAQLARPAKFKHNFQFTAGVAFRLGDYPSAESDAQSAVDGPERTPRFEAGAQFTALNADTPSAVPQFSLIQSDDLIHTEPGFGGRLTFNLTDNIAFEAEGNFYTRDLTGGVLTSLPNPSGHMFQGQFGAKIGKRFSKWGVFGKARPGFVGFTKVNELVSAQTFNVQFLTVGQFRIAKKFYPSMDIGGVVEFYLSRRWMARFDIGDTVIRYGELFAPDFLFRNQLVRRPPETHNNLQVTSGIGFRF